MILRKWYCVGFLFYIGSFLFIAGQWFLFAKGYCNPSALVHQRAAGLLIGPLIITAHKNAPKQSRADKRISQRCMEYLPKK